MIFIGEWQKWDFDSLKASSSELACVAFSPELLE
jgi:hypothetical protein